MTREFNYTLRRNNVFRSLANRSILILPSNPLTIRSWDTENKYRQNSDILYLCGCQEEDSILVMLKLNDEEKTLLFVQPRDPSKETWTGKRIGHEKAKDIFNVDESFENNQFTEWISENLKNFDELYFPLGTNSEIENIVLKTVSQGKKLIQKNYFGIKAIIDPGTIIHGMRVKKEQDEINIMKEAGKIASEAHIKAMKSIKPNMYEYEVEAIIDGYFRSKGATAPAYSTICASGENATILHYITNSEICKAGDLILIDAGCEYKNYASDITRTFPINGKFSEVQKAIYQIVLKAQKMAIEKCIVGNTTQDIHENTIKILTEGLVDLGILNGEIDKLIEEEQFKPYYMHGTGHYLGIDTHDVGYYKLATNDKSDVINRPLENGMIITIEPGLYFNSTLDIPEKYKGIGVRIEDDILITNDGPDNLTSQVPKEIDEIEKLIASK